MPRPAFGTAFAITKAGGSVFMFSTKIKNVFKGFVLVSAMAFGLILVSTTTTSAQQYPNYGGYGTYGQYDRYDRNGNQNMRAAYQRGYKDGLRQGKQDGGNGYANSRYGRYGNDGAYNRNGGYWGNNSPWRQAYNDGYNRGYSEGMNRARNDRYRPRRVISFPLPY